MLFSDKKQAAQKRCVLEGCNLFLTKNCVYIWERIGRLRTECGDRVIMGPVVRRDSGVDFHVMWMDCSLLNHSPTDEHGRFPVFLLQTML